MEGSLYKKKEKERQSQNSKASITRALRQQNQERDRPETTSVIFTPSTTNTQVSTAVTAEVGKAVGPAAEATAVT